MQLMPAFRIAVLTHVFGVCASAQPTFTDTPLLGSESGGPFMIDVDSDGDPDLVYAEFAAASIRLSLNNGDETFAPFVNIDTGTPSARFVFGGDVDGDGDIDLVSASQHLKWHENDGNSPPSFTNHTLLSGREFVNVVVADLEGDGPMEIVACVTGSAPGLTDGSVVVFTFDPMLGAVDPVPVIDLAHPDAITALCVADLDGDLDGSVQKNIVFGTNTGGMLHLELGAFGGLGFLDTISYSGTFDFRSIQTIDANGDGHLDVLAVASGSDEYWLFINKGLPVGAGGGFEEPVTFATGAQPWVAGVADYDLDGDEDFVLTLRSGGQVVLYDNNGAGVFTSTPIQSGFGEVIGLVPGDMDSDGDHDFVVQIGMPRGIYLFENDLFDAPVRNIDTGSEHATIADALANTVGSDRLTVDNALFAQEPTISTASVLTGNISIFGRRGLTQPIGGQYTLAASDMLITDNPPGTFATVAGTPVALSVPLPARFFGSVSALNGGPFVAGRSVFFEPSSSIDIGDSDALSIVQLEGGEEIRLSGTASVGEDGALGLFAEFDEAAQTTIDGEITLGDRAVIVTDGDLTLDTKGLDPGFEPRDITTSALRASAVFAMDIDGDGDVDVLSASSFDDAVRWYENDGASPPSFTMRVITMSAINTKSVFASDVDGDGDVDVLSASFSDGVVRWHENDGASPPSFTARIITMSAFGASAVSASDVDGDGDVDVLSASQFLNTVRWHENDGASPPSFTAHDVTTITDGPTSVFATDVDDDGDVDVLSASFADDAVRWHENDGASPPSFTAHDITTSAISASSVSASDMDGDGDVDVLSASSFDDAVRWYENDGASPPSFTARVITTSADGAFSVFASDVDGDGDVDVLSGSVVDDAVRWYENDGASPPSFTAHDITTSADGVRSVFASDVDGDGDVDVLSASEFDNGVRWYEVTFPGDVLTLPERALIQADGIVTNLGAITIGSGALIDAEGGVTNEGLLRGAFGTVLADTTNSPGGVLEVPSSLQIVGDLTNDGTVRLNGALSVSGLFTNNGVIDTSTVARGESPVTLFAQQGVSAGASSSVLLPAGSSVITRRDVDIAIDDSARLDLSGATLRFNAEEPSVLEAMSTDVGASPDGLDRNGSGRFPIGTLRVAGNTLDLIDARDNDGTGQGAAEAMYVTTLAIDAGATLNTNGIKVYYETLINNGTITTPSDVCPIVFNQCSADFDNDGDVDLTDFGTFGAAFGSATGDANYNADADADADFDDDGDVDLTDFGTFGSEFGRSDCLDG